MAEIITCPSCHRKLQVPESLLGQDVQCPTCGATFVGALTGQTAVPAPTVPLQPAPVPQGRRPAYHDRYGDDYDDRRDAGYPPSRRRDLLPHRGSAVLTLGILSLVTCAIGIVLGIIAWVMGQNDLQEMRAGRMDPEGEGITNAGRICGIIGTCLYGTLFVLWLFGFMLQAARFSRF